MATRTPSAAALRAFLGLIGASAALVWVAVCVTPTPAPAELAIAPSVSAPPSGPGHAWRRASDGTRLYERVYEATTARRGFVLYVSGIGGPGGHEQPEFIATLARRGFEVRVLHPRGSGYSEGPRGDITDLDRYIGDYREGARVAPFGTPVFVVGHSLGGVFALRVATGLRELAGLVLINPAHRYASSRGSSPSILQYVAYAAWMVLAPGRRVVDMGGRPSEIGNPDDRAEAIRRLHDPLVVRWFSLRAMVAVKRVMDDAPADAAGCSCPLLLVDGDADAIVDRSGHAALLDAYAGADKTRMTVPGGGHGYSTVLNATPVIADWMDARAADSGGMTRSCQQ